MVKGVYRIMKVNENVENDELVKKMYDKEKAFEFLKVISFQNPSYEYYMTHEEELEEVKESENIKFEMSKGNVLSLLGLLCICEIDYKRSDNNDILNVIAELKGDIRKGIN